jgi:hypothetical protein
VRNGFVRSFCVKPLPRSTLPDVLMPEVLQVSMSEGIKNEGGTRIKIFPSLESWVGSGKLDLTLSQLTRLQNVSILCLDKYVPPSSLRLFAHLKHLTLEQNEVLPEFYFPFFQRIDALEVSGASRLSALDVLELKRAKVLDLDLTQTSWAVKIAGRANEFGFLKSIRIAFLSFQGTQSSMRKKLVDCDAFACAVRTRGTRVRAKRLRDNPEVLFSQYVSDAQCRCADAQLPDRHTNCSNGVRCDCWKYKIGHTLKVPRDETLCRCAHCQYS